MKNNLGVFFLIVSIFSVCQISNSQIPNGTWRDHFAYRKGLTLAITPKKVFCGMENGAMLVYQKDNGQVEKISKVTGLSDIDITGLSYSSNKDVLVVGYASGNIDIINSSGIVNLSDIKRKTLAASKRINKIKTYNSFAYVACDFGIVVVDLDKYEIKDSYFFGPNGTSIKVNDLAIQGNILYAATELGLYQVDMNAPNLLDHSFWERITSVPQSNNEYKIVEGFENKVFAVYEESATSYDKIQYLNNNNWEDFTYSSDTLINSINAINNQLCITGNTNAKIYNQSLTINNNIELSRGMVLLVDVDGTIFAAEDGGGFRKHVGTEKIELKVEAPLYNPEGQVAVQGEHVWITSGGPNNRFRSGGAHNFFDERWLSMISGWGGGMNDVGNFYKIAFHPNNPNHFFASAYGYGLWEIDDYQVIKEHRRSNTPLFQSMIQEVIDVRIMGLDFDRKGDLWTIFDVTTQPLYVLRGGEEWENISVNTSSFKQTTNYTDLIVTQSGQIWVLSRTQGIVVLKEESNGSISHKHFSLKNQDNEAISKAYCMVEDKEGYIWIGTNKGPVFFPPIGDVFTRDNIVANSVKIPRNDGSGLADYLLDYETINDISVDGANRKWIATANSGAFLVSSDGLKTIHQFTFDNSPLISNNIISVGASEATGEVFLSTNKGIVSYGGTATEANEDFEDVYVYPNPVRPEYEGDVTITGIIANANVKITDISGNLVYETTSLGGQAVWDGKNFDGHRVSTGVYLVFMTNDDGTKTHITKLLFVN